MIDDGFFRQTELLCKFGEPDPTQGQSLNFLNNSASEAFSFLRIQIFFFQLSSPLGSKYPLDYGRLVF